MCYTFRSPVNKHEPKAIPSPAGQPLIVRADITSPEKPVIERSSRTARAAVFSSASRKHQYHGLSSLPSRPTVPKWTIYMNWLTCTEAKRERHILYNMNWVLYIWSCVYLDVESRCVSTGVGNSDHVYFGLLKLNTTLVYSSC